MDNIEDNIGTISIDYADNTPNSILRISSEEFEQRICNF